MRPGSLARLGGLVWALTMPACALRPTATAPVPGAGGLVPIRQELLPTEKPSLGFGAYGYILLTRDVRPGEPGYARHDSLCVEFVRAVPLDTLPPGVEPARLLVNYWPTRTRTEMRDCSAMLSGYDHARAQVMLAALGKTGVEGPVLVAFDRPFGSDGQQLMVDLSGYDDRNVGRLVRVWVSHSGRAPAEWHGSLRADLFREMLRDTLQQFGMTVVEVLTKYRP